MKNRIISCLLVACCILSLCSCSNSKQTVIKPTGKQDGYTYNPYNTLDGKLEYYNYYDMLNSQNNKPDGNNSQNNNNNNSQNSASGEETVDKDRNVEVITDAPFVKWESAKLTAPGKAFTLPNVNQKSGAPIVAELTKQVYPGDSITVMGEGFESSGVKAYYVSDNKTKQAEFKVINDTQMAVTIGKNENYGVYGVYVENNNGTSAIKTVNVPSVWWIDCTDVNAGDEVSIYGENLTYNNETTSNVYLLDGDKWFKMNVISADPHKITVQVPQGLVAEKQYSLKIHNGHGGEATWADSQQKLTFKQYKINTIAGNVINVLDYGANNKDSTKNSVRAIYSAIQSAEIGDTIYFPAGTYLMKSGIAVDKSLKFVGDGADKTKIIMYDKISDSPGALFTFKAGPIEISNIGFEDVRKKKLNNYFIRYTGDGHLNGNYNLYIHDCSFIQSAPRKTPYAQECILAENATNIWIKNNVFESQGVLFANKTENLIVKNNKIIGAAWAIANYHQNQLLVWDTHKFDFSNNYVCSKDLITDPDGTLEFNDQTNGRTISMQQSNSKVYIGHNELERVGLPSDNAGEQFLFEDMFCLYDGKISSPTSKTLDLLFEPYGTLPSHTVVMITEGKGIGQYRYVKNYNISKKQITLDKDWEIVPDSTSRIIVFKSFSNIAVYKNTISGYKNHNTDFGMTNGTCLYGNMVNGFITHNDFSDMPYGMLIVDHYRWGDQNYEGKGNASRTSGLYWIQCDYNKVKNCSIGFSFTVENMFKESSTYQTYGPGYTELEDHEVPTNLSLGFTFRGNNIDGMSDFLSEDRSGFGGIGILVGSMDWRLRTHPHGTCNGGWLQGTLIENNVFKNCANNNIVLCKHQGNTILSGNSFTGDAYGVDPSKDEPNHTSTAIITPPVEYIKSGS